MINYIINDLLSFLQEVDDHDYSKACCNLSSSSIGQHVRHSIEIYQCLITGYENAEINYSNRKRDVVLETSSSYAVQCLQGIVQQLPATDKPVFVLDEEEKVPSSFKRELLYCNEHLIHHMALIKVAIKEIGKYTVPATFGVAPSTIKFRQQCAQ